MKRIKAFSYKWVLNAIKYILILNSIPLQAQIYPLQNAHWTFGTNASLVFSCYGTYPNTSSITHLEECTSSIADESGNLLFYFNDSNVWAGNDVLMPNGTELIYRSFIWQASLAVPQPGDSGLFFIFNTFGVGEFGQPINPLVLSLLYSKVDMNLNSGLGDVMTNQKNIVFDSNQTNYPIAAAHHANNKDFWLVTQREIPPASFQSYLITEQGISNSPVESPLFYNRFLFKDLKFSPNGELIAGVTSYYSTQYTNAQLGYAIFLAKFDRVTGVLMDPIVLPMSPNITTNAGKLEFSPCGDMLMVGDRINPTLKVFDLSIYDSSAIATSEVIYNSPPSESIRMGIDGKIYKAPNVSGNLVLDEITIDKNGNVTILENAVNFSQQIGGGITNQVSTNRYGLISPRAFCVNDTSQIDLLSCADSATWIFFDPETGDTAAVYSGDSIEHVFTQAGEHPLHLWLTHGSITDTIIQHVCVSQPIEVNDLLPDTAICEGDTLVVDLSNTGGLIQWSDGQSDLNVQFLETNTFSYSLTNACGVFRDTFVLRIDSLLSFDLGSDSIACIGDSVSLKPDLSFAQTVLWNDGSSGSTFQATTSQTVTLLAQNTCGSDSDSIALFFTSAPNINLPFDTAYCDQPPQFITLESDTLVNYVWNDSVLLSSRLVNDSGTYRLIAFNVCGSDTHDISVSFQPEIETELLPQYILCANDSVLLDVTTDSARYNWSTNDTSSFIYVTEEGEYVVSITANECVKIISTDVVSDECDTSDCKITMPNIITPNADGINDIFTVQSSCDQVKIKLSIYNRWGQLMVSNDMVSSSKNQVLAFWDGFVNGIPASAGVYFYTIRYQSRASEQSSVQNGTVQVIR